MTAMLPTAAARLITLENDIVRQLGQSRLRAELETPREDYVCPGCAGPGANHSYTGFETVVKCSCPCHG